MTNMEEMLIEGAAALGIRLNGQAVCRFSEYKRLLLEWNKKINLTAITSDMDICVKHFLDSLTVLYAADIADGSRLIDVGTGAGFPSLPVKIAKPEIELTLLDSLGKRVKFLDEVTNALGLERVSTVCTRAEEAGRATDMRDCFDMSVSRAVARLRELCEYCLPFVKPGGVFVALKGNDVLEELEEAKPAIAALNAEVCDVKTLTLPFSDNGRSLITIKKLRQTPLKYPRNQTQISKSPIK